MPIQTDAIVVCKRRSYELAVTHPELSHSQLLDKAAQEMGYEHYTQLRQRAAISEDPMGSAEHRITAAMIAEAKRTCPYRTGPNDRLHEHDDCIRMAYEWLDAQVKTKRPSRSARPLKYWIERWCGRYVSQSDVEVAAHLHADVHGLYPYLNVSKRMTVPNKRRLDGIKEAFKHNYHRDFARSEYRNDEA